MIDNWSSSVLAKIFNIDGVAKWVLRRTRPRFVDVVFIQITAPKIGTLGVSHRLLVDIERV